MSTTRNTKGQFARKKAVKKPSLADIQHYHGLTAEYLIDFRKELSGQLDQIQRDIEQVRTLAHQTRTNSRANTVILNKTLAGVDLLKSGSSFMQEVKQHRAQPEEPKAEPWEPKVGDWVVFKPDPNCPGAPTTPGRVSRFVAERTVVSDDWKPPIVAGEGWHVRDLRPATPEEIAQAEGEWKLKKLVRGCKVDTPDGEGIYLGRGAAAEGHPPYWVSLDRDAYVPSAPDCFDLDQLTPLT